MQTKINITLCAILALVNAGLSGAARVDIKEDQLPCDRLPLNVRPKEYQLELNFGALDSAGPFNGLVNITLDFVKGTSKRFYGAKRTDQREQLEQLFDLRGLQHVVCPLEIATNEIVLHAGARLEIESIQVVSSSELRQTRLPSGVDQRKELRVAKVVRDPVKEMLSIRLASSVAVGSSGWIAIRFSGQMNEDEMEGVYLSQHKNRRGELCRHIVSHFQPTNARQVFPAFDEPRFKTPFKLIIGHPKNLRAFSNSEPVESTRASDKIDSLTRTEFEWTPRMSVHMVAFTVGQYGEPLELETRSAISGKPYKVRLITAPGLHEPAHFALMVAKESLEYFEKYIHHEFPLDKLDIVAIADHPQDNTESWGLAFIRDSLVWIDDQTKPDTKIATAVNVAHVCVHQWFANLVTPAWWSEVWITEGVAAQFSLNIVRELYPQLESEYFVRLATLSGVMQLDIRTQQDDTAMLRPLAPDASQLKTSEEIGSLFGPMTFMKSAALMQMLANYLGADRYKATLNRLVQTRAYDSIELNDLINSIQLTGQPQDSGPAERMLTSWSKLTGVPILEIRLNDEPEARVCIETKVEPQPPTVDLLIHTNAWYSSKDQGGIQLIQLESQEKTNCLTGPEWFPAHSKSGFFKLSLDPDFSTYFRSNYSPELLARLKRPIQQQSSVLSAMDRLQILDDAHALFRNQLMSLESFEQLASWYENEPHGGVLLAMLEVNRTLTQSSPLFQARFMRLFQELGFTASGRESPLEQRSREAILMALVASGDQQVTAAALEAFDAFVADDGELALFLRAPVYLAVVKSGSNEQVNRLFAMLEASQSHEERRRIASAFAELR